MNKEITDMIFRALNVALIKEDEILHNLMAKDPENYSHFHNGISCLYETTLVYITWKELMNMGFPYLIHWEYPYPENPSLKADMGILKDNSLLSLVEFKIWSSEKGKEVFSDFDKYRNNKTDAEQLSIVIEPIGGPIDKNAEYILSENKDIELLNKTSFLSKCYITSENKLCYKPVNLYMFRMIK
ncbi:MAG: hypothetical protein IKN65_08185 [Clostridia bacterium]|nr:hypothetical protein [Clostridia bacterium]MBR4261427.1 hypothetical protein [Clostridia bacterium]